MSESHAQPTRRTIARGLAWTAPVVAVAAAAPAYALSGPPPTFQFLGSCKSPGNSCAVFPKGYDFRFNVCNNSQYPIWIYSVSYTAVGTNLTLIHAKPTLPYQVAANTCLEVVFRADSSNSANQAFNATMTIPWGHCATAGCDTHIPAHTAVVVPFTVPGTPPDCACTATP